MPRKPPTPEQRRKWNKRYSELHKEEIRAKDRARREADPKKTKAYLRDWHLRNKEKTREKQRRYVAAHPEQKAQWSARWRDKNRHKVRDYTLAKYGITHNTYESMLAIQKGRCLICDAEAEEAKNSLHVDHDHKSGDVRGLLCFRCNVGLGMFQDNAELLTTAVWYLDEGFRKMSSITEADFQFGGRLMTACDALAAGKLRTAAAIFNEVAGELNLQAEAATGLLSEEAQEAAPVVARPEPLAPQLATASAPADLQMCARGVHSYGPSDPISGWRTCASCQMVNVSPPENQGAIDMSARQ